MAGALVGGAFLSASLQVLFDRLASREVVSFIRGQKLGVSQLKKLERKLLVVHAVLNDAEVKQFTNPFVKKWLVLLKEAVFDAEDVLDEIATQALRQKMEAKQSHIRAEVAMDRSTWLLHALCNAQSIESRVEEVIDRLEDMERDIEALGLKEGIGWKLPQRWPSTSLVDESTVYGRDDEKHKMIELLLSDNNARSNEIGVISIVGMGGAGKTTLAQLLYNDQRVKEHFDLEAWVCVSEDFDPVRITKAILEAIDLPMLNTTDLNLLQIKLKESITMKKFLLVVDDVWNEDSNTWALIQTPLIGGAKGSKVIVTTRSTNVAAVMRAIYTHHLGQLSSEDSLSLFRKLAFQNGDSSAYPHLEAIGKRIVDKCQGLPLAIKALGSLLYSKFEAREWDAILNNEIWDLSIDLVGPALRLSYIYLPSHLKRCFAYCSIFPKDYEFNKEKLILLWMAEGFLQESKSKRRMEEVGELYFQELLSKSFFQKSASEETSFVMHDLIHDLAKQVSHEFSICLEDGEVHHISETTRHLSYFAGKYDTFDRYERLSEFKSLRTFLPLRIQAPPIYISNRVLHNLLPKLRCLRVLCLSCYWYINLPYSIGMLQHLRYLDLSHTLIKTLPKSICSLYNLQTLKLAGCSGMNELPSRMENLINLRYLDISDTELAEIPSHIGDLKCLQKLNVFIVSQNSKSGIGELKQLSNIHGNLRISKLQNVKCGRDAMEANLKEKRYLDELELAWDYDSGNVMRNGDIIDSLRPHTNLKTLSIYYFGGLRFPGWLADPLFSNLLSLRLSDCKNCSSLVPLGQLPSLKHLWMSRMEGIQRVGCEFYHYGNASSFITSKPYFPSLQTLTFEQMSKWEKWLCCGCRRGEFPHLQELCMIHCPKLTGKLPKQLKSLKNLVIDGCPQLLVASLRVPKISELKMVNSGELQLKRPAGGFSALQSSHIEISDISQWKHLPVGAHSLSITKCDSLEDLMEEPVLQRNTFHLRDLEVTYCSSRSLHRVGLPTNTLKSLQISHCSKLEFLLPELLRCHHPLLENIYIAESTCESLALSISFSLFPKLHNFEIHSFEGLEFLSIFSSEGDPTSLNYLAISDCPSLVYIELPAHDSAWYEISRCLKLKLLKHTLSTLQGLSLRDCPELLFQRDGLPSHLREFQISSCNQLTSQMDWGLHRLTSLRKFTIGGGCKEMHSFPVECLLPSTITSLEIYNIQNLKSLDSKGLQQLNSLVTLLIRECPKLESFGEEGLQHLTSLTTLYIRGCPQFESFTEAGLQYLISLEELRIVDCSKLQYLTKDRLPNSLSCLTVMKCPLLERHYEFGKGQYWSCIAHIPHIIINHVLY